MLFAKFNVVEVAMCEIKPYLCTLITMSIH